MGFGQHLRLRWWQRGARKNPKLEEAWNEAFDVHLPNSGYNEARLHAKTNTIILRKSRGGGTVLNSENMIVIKDGVPICGNCLHAVGDDWRCPNAVCPQ